MLRWLREAHRNLGILYISSLLTLICGVYPCGLKMASGSQSMLLGSIRVKGEQQSETDIRIRPRELTQSTGFPEAT